MTFTELAQLLVLLLVITGPVTILVVSGIALLSRAQRLSHPQWQHGVAALVSMGVVAILILSPIAWRFAPWVRITI